MVHCLFFSIDDVKLQDKWILFLTALYDCDAERT